MAITGALIGDIIQAITTVMYGMILGLTPISTTIIQVGITDITMATILTSVQASRDGVEEVQRHSPIIAHQLQPLRAVNRCQVVQRLRQVHHARVPLQVV